MALSTRLRLAVIGVTLLGLGTLGHAQQSQKRNGSSTPTTKSGTKSGTKSKERTADSKVQPAGGSEAPKKPRPRPVEMKIEPLPPELETILREWEEESAKIKRIVGKHERIVYNKVFEVQKNSRGEFYYEAPDKGRIDVVGIEPKKGEKSKRVNPKTQSRYRLEKDQQSKWICTGTEILSINEDEKTYEAFPLPPDLQGANIINGPLPFLFGMKSEEAKKRFAISFVDQDDPNKNNEHVVWLNAVPRQEMDKENFQLATIILDRKRYVPFSVKLIDPAGTTETVYNFPADDLEINSRDLLPAIFRNKPFEPNLKNYKMILPPSTNELQQGKTGGKRDAGVQPVGGIQEEKPRSRTTVTPKSGSTSSARTKK